MSTSAPVLGEPAPVELMNTIWADRDGVHDALASTTEAIDWMVAMQPATPLPITETLLSLDEPERTRIAHQLRRLRDALRELAAKTTADPRDIAAGRTRAASAAVTELNRAAAAAPRYRVLSWPDDTTPPGPSARTCSAKPAPQAFISQLADETIALLADATRVDLRACLAPGCVLYFVKHHPRREWCSPACGNRARVTRHYHRHHPRGDTTSDQDA